MIRIQFDISQEELNRMIPFILKEKNRHVFAEKALSEWINRQEGRNRRRIKTWNINASGHTMIRNSIIVSRWFV